MRTLLLGLSLSLLPGTVPAQTVSAQNRPATCARDLFQTQAALSAQQKRMQDVASADQAAQCGVWRNHVKVLQGARATYATCQSGRQRDSNVAEMDEVLGQFRVLLAERCGRSC